MTWDFVIYASIGLLLLCLVAFLSMDALKRRINYEVWYAVHLLVYLVIPLAFMHQIKTGNDLVDNPRLLIFWCGLYAFSYGNLVIFRLIKPLFLFSRHRFTIDRIERESDDVVSL